MNINIKQATMDKDAAERFAESIGRAELFEELKSSSRNYPRFLKGVLTSLIEVGFDESWVNGELRNIIDRKYMDTSDEKKYEHEKPVEPEL